MSNLANMDFENEVRRIARAKWPSAQFSGAQILEGRERDGIFETEEAVHFVEATVSSNAGKAREDAKKLFRAITEYNRAGSMKVPFGWFITKNEPTADQRQEVQEVGKGQVRALSFSQFQQSLVDARSYLAARRNHGFGSVQDFNTPAKTPSVPFIEIGLTDSSGTTFLVAEIVEKLLNGSHFALVGQYGAGKSMTLREIFFRLEEQYIKGKSPKFPIYINLREHSGQRDPVELLERHARSIGFDSPTSLIRAWRAGFLVLLIDGFDEVTSLGVQGSWKKLKDLRLRSLEGIRQLIRDSQGEGIIVSGRSHYFEDDRELSSALGLRNSLVLSIDEFTESQMKSFLSRFPGKFSEKPLPLWLPTRPLLLGYLASKGLLEELESQDDALDAVDGWDFLLTKIYEREERIETNLDGQTLRRILERAATLARTSEGGLGPITRSELFSAFHEVCGYEPDDQGVLAIQRLPGLGIYRAEDESRCFVDKELAEVCKGRDLLRFIESPYDAVKDPLWLETMNSCSTAVSSIGAELVVRRLKEVTDIRGMVRQAVAFLQDRTDLICARGDIASVVLTGQVELDLPLSVFEVEFSGERIEFHTDLPDLNLLSFKHCLFEHLSLSAEVAASRLPAFEQCLFNRVSGRVSSEDLPRERFADSCEIITFDATGSSGAIREAEMSIGEKVLLITLRKLFLQSLSGRAESALFRGLDVDERRCVPEVLRLLKRHQLVTQYSRGDGIIWLPARKALDRVKRIVAAPAECGEEVVREAREVG